MDIGSLLLGLALLVVVVFIAGRPLLEQAGQREQPATPAEQLINSRERVLVQLRDLDFDDATGKINAEDYAAQRAKLVAEGVAILKQLDALGVTPEEAAATPDDAIEAAVAQRRAGRAPAGPSAAVVARAQRDSPRPAGAAPGRVTRAPKATAAPARPLANRRDVDAEIEANIAQRRSKTPEVGAAATNGHGLRCGQCGADVLASDRFCPKCGSPQIVACGNCGREARAGDQFCAQCGQALPAMARTAKA